MTSKATAPSCSSIPGQATSTITTIKSWYFLSLSASAPSFAIILLSLPLARADLDNCPFLGLPLFIRSAPSQFQGARYSCDGLISAPQSQTLPRAPRLQPLRATRTQSLAIKNILLINQLQLLLVSAATLWRSSFSSRRFRRDSLLRSLRCQLTSVSLVTQTTRLPDVNLGNQREVR